VTVTRIRAVPAELRLRTPCADRHPPARRGLVRRRTLFERLSAAEPGGVVVVQAPAGSGKTVLLRSWIKEEGLEGRVAWVSVDPDEHDAQRFWLSVVDELSSVSRRDLVELVTASPDVDGEIAVERLSSELDSLDEPLALVIDDLHELRSARAVAWLDLFLARLPSQLVVVLATREEPRVGLHRLRLGGELAELRASDLRFSLEETRELLEMAGIALSEAGVQLLHQRSEGWAAGLRLAIISLVEHPEPERFATEFSGSERTVAGYLLAEVLQRQPAEVRELLLRTSILDRVSGPLADFLTGNSGSERVLQQLEDANAFVSSLDVGRLWFRYHRLFADLLRLELRRVSGTAIESLHRAAGQWYETHGYVVEAIRHSQAAGDWAHAARLLADHHLSLRLEGRGATVYDLMAAFPAYAATADPELALVFASGRAFEGRLDESAAYLDAARRLAASVPSARRPRFGALMAGANLWQASRRQDLGAALAAMRSLETALRHQQANAHAVRGDLRANALGSLGACELSLFELESARRHLEQALELARRIGRPWLEISCLSRLASLAPLSGRPASVSLRLAQDAVAIAEENGWQEQPVTAAALAVGGEVLTWLGRFDEAERWLDRADRAQGPPGTPGADPGTELEIQYARGLLRLGQGRLDQALEAFRTTERIRTLLPADHLLTIESRARMLETQVWMGEAEAASGALDELGELARDRAELRVTAAAIALAEGAPDGAVGALVPVIEGKTRALHPAWAPIEALLLDAAARDALGDRCAADASIERALELAEPDGVILPFTLAPVRELLERVPRHRTAHATLLTTILDLLAGRSLESRGEPPALIDELSVAELRVVRYLPSNLKVPEIASELFVSANTVRTHLRHIYAKLDVHNRGEAVARARELRLLGPAVRLVA
jgi:LuxR family transcriptional regulator, maltose regulon positive regulatory protein